jgi:hypothetical protein
MLMVVGLTVVAAYGRVRHNLDIRVDFIPHVLVQ